MTSILETIEKAGAQNPHKPAVALEDTALTYQALLHQARQIGTLCASLGVRRQPIGIYLEKTPQAVAAFLGVAYSGNCYTVLDTGMPGERVGRIFETLHPAALLTDRAHEAAVRTLLPPDTPLLLLEDALLQTPDIPLLQRIRRESLPGDPFYILYTSGSTGQPKGVVVSHRAVLAYIAWAVDTFSFDPHHVFGSQTPFFFSMSVTDLYGALCSGATLQILPKTLFSFPQLLLEEMNRRGVNILYWVPSALCLVANWDTFSYIRPDSLETVLFAGERMPNKQLNYWRKHLPKVRFANLFGPTETTDICTWYEVDRPFADDEPLPIGRMCRGCRGIILDEAGREATTGELYVTGPFLAEGYYNNPQKTADAFVQNPLQQAYPEIYYRTGDLVTRDETGILWYLGRRDHQIKHLGYRIELGEIETAAGGAEGVRGCCCLLDAQKDRLVLFYEGNCREEELAAALTQKLPPYMQPNRLVRLKVLPKNANGKIDRTALQAQFKQE